MGMPELEIYSLIGAEGFARLVAAFYRQIPQDDLLGPIYPANDLPGAEQRLRDFLIGRFGGASDLH
jgi:hemoglobin